tara:strand:+ start:691 stop:873 length:183 start_codon:yes stop_codon:yes gene_type:complete
MNKDEKIFWNNQLHSTKYCIRDVWDLDTLIDLKVHLDDVIQDKANTQDGIANLAEDAYKG